MKRQTQFETIRSEGGLLPIDLLQRVREADKDLGGLRGEDYGLPPNEPLNEAIVRSWNRLLGAWGSFQVARANLADDDPGTTVTRERWLLVLLHELGYGRVQTANAVVIEGKSYAVSHSWAPNPVPIHLVGCKVKLDTRSRGVAGAATQSPHGTLQELLNRSDERLWGIVSNGLQLRLLRDNSSLTRQAYIEFDLEAMLDGEAYADFALLWLVCHASRVEGDPAHDCWLESWAQEATRQGTRALDGLRDGVEHAITALGTGFLQPGTNPDLKQALRTGELSTQDYYRQILRLVYRLLFLFVAEDRQLLHHPDAPDQARERYAQWYSTQRLRDLAGKRRGTKHTDLWDALQLVMHAVGDDDGCPALGLPPLGSYLWTKKAIEHLDASTLTNRALLDAVRALATVRDGKVLRTVDYKNLGAEELGSVYESLLELHPQLDPDAGTFTLGSAAGNERKTTGSYYTPTSLISCLLDTALDPVLDEATAKGEHAILDLKVCDPACGSGHFLVAAAHRIARRLASARTGEEEPSPEATRHALRDVVSRCLYGVDINPMAVELCKVSLWMEALDPGRPLSFLDAHIKCGNSLLGTSPELIRCGIPDDAFKPIQGDDKDAARALRNGNRDDRSQVEGQLTLEGWEAAAFEALRREADALESINDTSLGLLREQERLLASLLRSEPYERTRLAADAWCAAFVQLKVPGCPRITTRLVRSLGSGNPEPMTIVDEIRRLADEYGFFHWEIEFPAVFGRDAGGFDVVLGNPPWERVKLQEKEFFAAHLEISGAKTSAARKVLIEALRKSDPVLHAEWLRALRRSDGESHLLRASGRYPLCGRGDVNTYAVFAELMGGLRATRGYSGCIVPSGIASDHTTQDYFDHLMRSGVLSCLYGFENEGKLFAGIDHRVNFSILTLGPTSASAEFASFLRDPRALDEPGRRYHLSYDDISLFNPNTRTCPVLKTDRDLAVLRRIYSAVPVLWRDEGNLNPWDLSFLSMFHMSNDSQLFKLSAEVDSGAREQMSPLYESKMINQFDHRFGDFGAVRPGERDHMLPPVLESQHADPAFLPQPRYWVPSAEVERRLLGKTDRSWLLGWRDVTDARSSARTVIATFLPRVGVGGNMPLAFTRLEHTKYACLLANLNSFVLDYAGRQKIGGLHLALFVLKQLPIAHPSTFDSLSPDHLSSLGDWIGRRVTELCFTAEDLEGLARDLGYDGGPFRWNPDRRALLRAELDAAFFHLYALEEEDVDYVMDTFPIVRRRDEQRYGEYRTKALILNVYRLMRDAIESGVPYETILDPPPADSRLAHSDAPTTGVR